MIPTFGLLLALLALVMLGLVLVAVTRCLGSVTPSRHEARPPRLPATRPSQEQIRALWHPPVVVDAELPKDPPPGGPSNESA